jgi:hypothetical protein
VLADTVKSSHRDRPLPAPAIVYYVMALAWRREARRSKKCCAWSAPACNGSAGAGAVQGSKWAFSP